MKYIAAEQKKAVRSPVSKNNPERAPTKPPLLPRDDAVRFRGEVWVGSETRSTAGSPYPSRIDRSGQASSETLCGTLARIRSGYTGKGSINYTWVQTAIAYEEAIK